MIFVQLVAYRDQEVFATMSDCLRKAKHPSNVRFGLVYQYMPEDKVPPVPKNSKCLHFSPDPGRGVGWMRNAANTLYQGEEYYLQIDAHTQFESGWDVTLIDQLENCGKTKPVLSTYPPMYWFTDGKIILGDNHAPIVMTATGWHPSKLIIIEPHVLSEARQNDGFALAGGFIFAPGAFATEVPYDPQILFIGEEITLAAQAYTRGYDIVHPAVVPVYHHYTRDQCAKPWTDFSVQRAPFNNASETRISGILANPPGGYFGSARTFEAYEQYSGISFKNYTISINSVNQAQVSRPKPF